MSYVNSNKQHPAFPCLMLTLSVMLSLGAVAEGAIIPAQLNATDHITLKTSERKLLATLISQLAQHKPQQIVATCPVNNRPHFGPPPLALWHPMPESASFPSKQHRLAWLNLPPPMIS